MSRYLHEIHYAECPRCRRRSTMPGRRDKRGNPGRWLRRHLRTVHGEKFPHPKGNRRRRRRLRGTR